ncbi:MAG: hypothetical protein ACT4QC_06185 [Planctomycetaceae bacterium]
MQTTDSKRPALLVSGYGSGATAGRNLGTPGYSYDFVVRLFEPLFRELGDCEVLARPEATLGERAEQAVRNGRRTVHLCFRGLHDAVFAPHMPNVVVPAWEFPDVPNCDLDGDRRQNWVRVANDSSLVIVHGEFTRDAFVRAGVRTPLALVPVPTPSEYFDLPDWNAELRSQIDCPAIVLGGTAEDGGMHSPDVLTSPSLKSPPHKRLRTLASALVWKSASGIYKRAVRPCLPYWLDKGLTLGGRASLLELFNHPLMRDRMRPSFELRGIVYTSIFNPEDGRKNWKDLLSAFLLSLGDCPDATLVLKLVGRDRHHANAILSHYRGLSLPHRCRVIIITDYLTDEQMLNLTQATTYYVTSTRAEGNCLPLMNSLAAGRPGISPAHTAIADYFSGATGFVVDSHSEPCAWPQDPQTRCRTTWHRLVWPSLVEAFRKSYQVARHDRERYMLLADRARAVAWDRHHPTRVLPRLRSALEIVAPTLRATPWLKAA